MTDHTVKVRSVQEYHGEFDPSFITDDGELDGLALDLGFHDELSLSFTCSCGERFLKIATATDHLRSVSSGDDR